MSNNQEIIGTPFAGLAFVFLSFCSFTDGKLTEEEVDAISSELIAINKLFEISHEDHKKNIDDAFIMYNGCSSNTELKDLFIKILDELHNASSNAGWSASLGEAIVSSLTRLMDADGERQENEIYWLETVKEVWKLDVCPDEDEEKGYPALSVRLFKDENGEKDSETQELVSKYMLNWQEKTETYSWRGGITARVPDFFNSINEKCPKWTKEEIQNINNYITKYKVIPSVGFQDGGFIPEEFLGFTKQVWWLVPFVIWAEETASWVFIDKNGFHAPHPGDNDGRHIFAWDKIVEINLEWEEDNLLILTLETEDGSLTFSEFVGEGMGSYLSVIESIYSVYQKTIEVSDHCWYHGAGGEGYQGFNSPKELLDEKIWKAVEPTNPAFYGYVDENKEKSQNSNGRREEEIIVEEDDSESGSSDELQVKSAVGNKSMLPFAELFKAEKNIKALDSIFEKSHSLWIENLSKINKVNYIMFCEAPPFDRSGSASNYIYDRKGDAQGMFLKAPYKALKGEVKTYPSKAEMIDFLNEKGFLFLDVLPLSIGIFGKRNTKQYRDFVKYFWNGNGTDIDFSEFIVQNRLNEIKDKISDDLRVCFALKSISLVVNSLDNSNLKFGDKTIHISDKLVGLNTAGQPGVTEITNAFKSSVLK